MRDDEGPDPPSERKLTAELDAGTLLDHTGYMREPIHRLVGVQTYGALVAVRAEPSRW